MAIYYKPAGNGSKVAVFPFMKSGKTTPRMVPVWKDGADRASYPAGAYHVLQFNHNRWTCSAVWKYGTGGSYLLTACPSPLVIHDYYNSSSTYTTTVTTGNYIVNPWYFVDMDKSTTRAFAVNKWAWTSTACTADVSAGGPWKKGTGTLDNHGGKMGIIYCDSLTGISVIDEHTYPGSTNFLDYKTVRPAQLIYGFIPNLNNEGLWPSTAMRAVFGAIIAVPKNNTSHAISMYYKGCTKNQFNHHAYYGTQYTRTKDNSAYYDHYQYAPYYGSNAMRQILSGYYTQSDIEGAGFADGHAKQIMTDGNYKYICVKGWQTITSADTDIFSPASVAYNGPSSPIMVDSWVALQNA